MLIASRGGSIGRYSCTWPAVTGSASIALPDYRPCGSKSFIACALGYGLPGQLSVLYQRSSRLFGALALALGRYARLMRQLARVNRSFWTTGTGAADRRAAPRSAGIVGTARCGSLIITSQVPVDCWHEIVGTCRQTPFWIGWCTIPTASH
jgi:hypothetical protein